MNQTIYIGLMASFLAGMATAIGALPILFTSKLEKKWQGMAAAAGTMLFVIVDEIIPEIDRESIAQEGTLGIMTGFVTMMFLDIAFG